MVHSDIIRVGVNGYGVIGKRVAAAVRQQDDMILVGVADVSADWRLRLAARMGFSLYGAAPGQISPDEYAEAEALVASKFATDAWLHRVP